MDLDADFDAALAEHRAGRLDAAEHRYRAILARENDLRAMHNLGVLLEATGRHAEAGEIYRQAVRASPDDAERQLALATHYRVTRQLPAAEAAYRRLLELRPGDAHAGEHLGVTLMAMGRYAEGWAALDARAARMSFPRQALSFPEWRGEPLAGKRLFVWREQGFGDQIMMARFLKGLGAAEVTYAGPSQLRRLFEALPVTFIEARPGKMEIPRHDYWSLPVSLPKWLGITEETVPGAPYLSGQAVSAGGRIGVVWRGQAGNANDRFRSLSADQAAPLLSLPGAISLDPADTGAADFQATADIIAGLDLVITGDTAVAHLAGAMGRPVWVLLAAHATDWQWPRQGASAWYPTARLFVQQTAGDWTPVVDAVRQAALGARPTS